MNEKCIACEIKTFMTYILTTIEDDESQTFNRKYCYWHDKKKIIKKGDLTLKKKNSR